MKISLQEIASKLTSIESPIYISFHKEPDGDAIGASIALYRALISMGKDAFILNVDNISLQFNFLISRVSFKEQIEEKGIIIFIDFSSLDKMQNINFDLDKDFEDVIFIDHRKSNLEDKYKEYTDKNVSSSAELIYDLIEFLGIDIDKPIAEAIYTGLISDTRSFKYSRTTAHALEIASKLTEQGIDNEQIQRRVFSASSLNELKVLGYVLLNSELSKTGKIAWSVLNNDNMKKYKITRAETKGFVNQLLTVNNVEIAVLFREDEKNKIKVSIRTKGRYGLKYIVSKFDGSFTSFSASFTYKEPLNEVFVNDMVSKLDRLASL